MRIQLLVLAIAACESTQAAPTPSAPALYDHDAMTRLHMRSHYDMASAIQHLVIRSDLYDVTVIARMIADAPDSPGLKRWDTDISLLRANARELSRAPNDEEACRRTARLMATCANCHVDSKVGAMFTSFPPIPADGPAIEQRMSRHVWATDRLFEGVVGGATDSWLAGLDALTATPAPFSPLDADRALLAKSLQDQATAAKKRAGDDFAARALAYGEILVTCSACHAADRTAHAGGR
jgi:cytochrome c553